MKLQPKIFSIILSLSTSVIAIIMIISLFVRSSAPVEIEEIEISAFERNYSIHALPIPESLSFADEDVPLKKAYVRESYDREVLVNTYWQSQTLLLIKRANRYFPIIEPILRENNVPDDFKFLALIESGLMPRALSPAGAAGIWQFMKGAAKDYGLEVSTEVDERYNIEKSTVAACKYLKKAYDKYGSWTLAAAAYNAGSAGIGQQLSKQKVDDYYNLLLGEETGRYVFRILALKQILSAPSKYGFHLTDEDLYKPIPFHEIEINGKIDNIADFAIEHGITYRELKDLNPWLREIFLTNAAKKSYLIKIPEQEISDIAESGENHTIAPDMPEIEFEDLR